MRSHTNILAWLPCLLLAATVPGLAVAFNDDPRPVVSQLDAEKRGDQRQAQSADEARLEARLETTLALNRSLQRSDIRVQVDGGNAVLEGTVDGELNSELAEELAMSVDGIESVDNRLDVDEEFAGPERDPGRRSFAQTVEDATTTTAVRSRLLWSRDADGVNTEVETRDGRVTLSGTAENEEAKQAAEKLARNAWGVTSVQNDIVVQPEAEGERTAGARTDEAADDDEGGAISDAWITTKVRSSFLTSRWISGTEIEIETNDGVVTLSGELDSAAERDLAIEVAENIRGVRDVDARNLTVVG